MNTIKTIKQWLSFILTVLLVVFLFGLIFIRLGFASLGPSFFLELGAVILITVQVRFWWWNTTEEKAMRDKDVSDSKRQYYDNVDATITDAKDFENYVKILNIENKDNYISNKIGSRTPENIKLNVIDWIFKTTKLKKYNKVYFRILRKADKIREIRSTEITSLTESKLLHDTKNRLKSKKRWYHTIMSLGSIASTTFLASLAFQELLLNWQNVARFVGYLFVIIWTIGMTIMSADHITRTETVDYISRLQVILDKYEAYKGDDNNGSNSESIGLPSSLIRGAGQERIG